MLGKGGIAKDLDITVTTLCYKSDAFNRNSSRAEYHANVGVNIWAPKWYSHIGSQDDIIQTRFLKVFNKSMCITKPSKQTH